MSPVALDHEENSAKCHHCHITKSIPLSELIKTHPLRSRVAKENCDEGEAVGHNEDQKEEDKDKNSVKDLKKPEKNGSLIESLLEEVANHKFKVKKKSSTSHSKDASNTSTLNREEPAKLVRPVHSYLHHVLDKSAYSNSQPGPSFIVNEDLAVAAGSHSENSCYKPSGDSSPSPELIINAKTLGSRKSSKFSTLTRKDRNKSNSSFPKDSETQTSAASSISRTSFSKFDEVRYNPNESPILIENHNSQKSSKFSTSTREKKAKSSALISRDNETQTSRTSSLSTSTYRKPRFNTSDITSIFASSEKRRRRKKCNVFFCSLPSGLLFAGYGLLIVIGIVVAVALSQRERQLSVQSKALPRRPQFVGAAQVPNAAVRGQVNRPRHGAAQGRRVLRPAHRPPPRQNVISIPAQAPRPAPPQAPPQQFVDADFDYLDNIALTDHDFLLPSKQPAPRPQQVQPKQQAFRPVEIQPQFRAQAPVQQRPVQQRTVQQRPVQQRPVQQQAPAPRRGNPTTFRQEFNLPAQAQQQEEMPRGQKEPAVQIIKSWSNRNSDGTFSYGYLNTDGSFKNETKGTDCVVRGVYGYIDKDTGKSVSFPYESGNPCDPNAPDYYYDYDEGTTNTAGGQVVQQPRPSQGTQQRRRPQ